MHNLKRRQEAGGNRKSLAWSELYYYMLIGNKDICWGSWLLYTGGFIMCGFIMCGFTSVGSPSVGLSAVCDLCADRLWIRQLEQKDLVKSPSLNALNNQFRLTLAHVSSSLRFYLFLMGWTQKGKMFAFFYFSSCILWFMVRFPGRDLHPVEITHIL